MKKKSIVGQKSFLFAVKVVRLVQLLQQEKKEYVLSKQVLRSGTSIGANTAEANGGISTADFSAKISIAYKEALETEYWLDLLKETAYITTAQHEPLMQDLTEILKILFSILKTTRKLKTKPVPQPD